MTTASTPMTPSFPINRANPSSSFPAPTSFPGNNANANMVQSGRERVKTGGSTSGADAAGSGGLWNEILSKASRQERKLPRKNVLILGEPNRGKSTLIQALIKTTPSYRSSQQSHNHYRNGGPSASNNNVATSSFAPFVYPEPNAGGSGGGQNQNQGRDQRQDKRQEKNDGQGSSRPSGFISRDTDITRHQTNYADRDGLARLIGNPSENEARGPVIMDDLLPLSSINAPTSSLTTNNSTNAKDAQTDLTTMLSLEPDIGLSFEWVDVNGDMENDSSGAGGGGGSGAEMGDIPMVGMWVPGGLGVWKAVGEVGGVLDLVKASLKGEELAIKTLTKPILTSMTIPMFSLPITSTHSAPSQHTAALIVLDWSKPHTMVPELLRWLAWLEVWYSESESGAGEGQGEAKGLEARRDMREKLQSYIQHYVEPKPPANTGTDAAGNTIFATGALNSGLTSYGGVENLLPLGPGVMTRNQSGIPIIIVCTRSDLVDSVGDRLISLGKVAGKGLGGGGSRSGDGRTDPTDWSWDERTDWAQQVLRVIALQYGASLFFLSTGQPHNYPLLRQHMLHRLYTIPPSLTPGSTLDPHSVSQSNRFAFPHRANVLDRDALLLPAGWDSWGKIKALNDVFDTKEMEEMCAERMEQLEDELSGRAIRQQNDGMINGAEDEDNIELWWEDVMPNPEDADALLPAPSTQSAAPSEQSFLTRQLDVLLRDPLRDARKAFRQGAPSISESGSGPMSSRRGPMSGHANGPAVIGPMGSTGMGGQVEMVLNGMASSLNADRKVIGGQDPMRTPSGKRDPSTPTSKGPTDAGAASGANSNDVLNSFFQGLIAGRKTPAGTPKAAGSS